MVYKKLNDCYNSIKDRIPFQPQMALILGSGLGDFAETLDIKGTIDYKDIKNFPTSTVSGHKGRFVFAYVGNVPTVIMQGRVHLYEGYEITDVVLPIRLLTLMGAKYLFLTNAAGGISFDFKAGDLMMITDHISSFVPNPLIGANIDELGLRFPDMSNIYDRDIQKIILETAEKNNIPLQKGVYIQTSGPAYESPAEIKMYRTLGADAVGMSTAIEAITANHCGMIICGVSCISNLACGMTGNPLTHEEVKETADKTAEVFKKLVSEIIKTVGNL
ncbi:MAG: purine-nucleoside phosphorylase [Clostridiales bacterium]|nr:purine-nucleoside phosphorylase [Clostridiales bacterium]